MRPFREKPGVISKDYVWVWYDAGYLYLANSFLGLLWVVLTEWKQDKHLVG